MHSTQSTNITNFQQAVNGQIPQKQMRGISLTKAALFFGIIVVACFSTIVGITLYKNSQGEIGTKTYETIVEGHDLLADVFPPPAYAIEAYANILHTLRHPSQAKENLEEFKKQKANFDKHIAHWKKTDVPEDIKNVITVDAHNALTEFWLVAEKDFFEELVSNPSANIHGAFNKIETSFEKHKEFIVLVEGKVEEYVEHLEKETAHNLSTLNSIFLTATVGSLIVLALALLATLKYVVKPMTEIANYTAELAKGNEIGDVPFVDRRDEIGSIANALTTFRQANKEKLEADKVISQERERVAALSEAANEERTKHERETAEAVDAIGAALKRMAAGDLTCQIDQPFVGDLDRLRSDLNSAIVQFSGTFNKILNTSESLGTGVREIVTASDDLSVRTEKQAAALEETATTLAQITDTVQKASEGAENTRNIVETAKTDAQTSGVVVEKALSAMGEIENSAKEISQIISVIDEIAFQTNLLALNAGVEAARAGEAGQGFAVVASEVRALAQRSAVAAKEIKDLISKSTEQVAGGSKLVGETGEALHKIADQVLEISAVVDEIAIGAKEQFSSLNDLNGTVSEMDAGTQQNAAMAEEATAACHSLRNEADELTNLMSNFKVDANATAPAVATAAHRPESSPAKGLISRVTTAFSGNAAVKNDEWQEF